jgi:hypothetical protein
VSDYARLKELAQNARPGPWRANKGWVQPEEGAAIVRYPESGPGPQFIAAVSPDVVLRLLSAVEGLQEALRDCRNSGICRVSLAAVGSLDTEG